MKFKCLKRALETVARNVPRWTGLAWFTLLVAPAVWGQGTLEYRVTFDGPPYIAPGTSRLVDSYSEAGILFQPVGGASLDTRFARAGGGRDGFPESYSAYLLMSAFSSLEVRSVTGAAFGLVSVDLAEFSTFYDYPATIPFFGYRSDGTIVETSFTTDGIIDGTGPLADFETFYFDARFNDLVRLEVPTYGWSLDNMVFSPVPEPGVGSLCGLAAAAMLCQRLVPGKRRAIKNGAEVGSK